MKRNTSEKKAEQKTYKNWAEMLSVGLPQVEEDIVDIAT